MKTITQSILLLVLCQIIRIHGSQQVRLKNYLLNMKT